MGEIINLNKSLKSTVMGDHVVIKTPNASYYGILCVPGSDRGSKERTEITIEGYK